MMQSHGECESKARKLDPVAEQLLTWLSLSIVQYISLLFIGLLIGISMRSFLANVLKVSPFRPLLLPARRVLPLYPSLI